MYQSQLIDALSEKSKALNEVLASLKKNGEGKTISLKDGTQITGESGNNGFTFIIKRNNTVVKKQSYKSLPSTNTLQSDFKTALEASILGDAKIKQSAPAKQEAKPAKQEANKPSVDQVMQNFRDILFRKSGEPPKDAVLMVDSDRKEIADALRGKDTELFLSIERKDMDLPREKRGKLDTSSFKPFVSKVAANIKSLPYVKSAEAVSILGGDLYRICITIKQFKSIFEK